MDALRQVKRTKKNSKRSNSKKDLKVVYISSPMKVKTCASQFRALVQELTGKDSDIADRFMDNSNYIDTTPEDSSDTTRITAEGDGVIGQLPLLDSNNDQSVFGPFDDGIMSEGSFLGMFTSNLFHDQSQFAAIRSFGSV
ncbi:Sigma factor binding protein 2 [Hibiscus syriacus]|uniref:Sigma factor binding protein 2 n=1 Tax=Hibiscus syriacus TaxID=106335 RepID=A0A6A3B805_HIBSY|nr:sigma factor binding protein 1, chloroplastic-like [Hibiscus syriacus]KAE8711947.1 Sigma factor binding protein 2 [Hibiscus syriacus]